jgi:hypothetical protein
LPYNCLFQWKSAFRKQYCFIGIVIRNQTPNEFLKIVIKEKTLLEKFENIYKANYSDVTDAGNFTPCFSQCHSWLETNSPNPTGNFFGGIEELYIYHVSLPILIPS